ncbi:Plasma membrane fusion protein PRM1 [Apiospora arundinis]|uniref:Plasma membrane fusion protein PRM1 n=1 Tax=Apiospora arundinis TaxID=335852 RepID=A0ABR2IGZ6_9PEZI
MGSNQDSYALPASLKGESFEMKPQGPQDPPNYSTTNTGVVRTDGHAPYLGLQARLSQIWLNRWTILLILVLVRVLLMLAGLNDNLGEAKIKALSACTKVEDVGSAMASMPHYLSVGVNRLTAKGITETVHGMMVILDMILTGVKELILFVINMMTSTYTCLISAAVHGGLNVSAAVITKTTDAMNKAIGPITDDIAKVGDTVQKDMNDVLGKISQGIGSIGSVFGKDPPKAPQINMGPDLDKLRNVKIDTSGFVGDLNKINQALPDFNDVQNFTRQAVSIPFDLVKKALNDTYGAWKFDDSVFPVAKKEALSFCSNNSGIVDFFENLFKLAHTAKIAFIAVICILAVLVCIPMAYWEIYRWRSTANYAQTFSEKKHDDVHFMMMGAHPFTSKIGLQVAEKISKDQQRRNLIQWAVAYGTSLPAIFVLSLAIAGFISCLCQYMVLVAVEKQVPALANQVGNFANEVVTSLEGVSEGWARDANGVVLSFQNEINNDVLGYVTNATGAVNDTLNVFTNLMDKGLTTVFGKTILEDPIKEVVRCLIGLKVEAVQKGLTWVHDHSKVSFPLFGNDTFSAGAQKSIDGDSDMTTFLASPSSVTTDEVTGAVTRVTNHLRNGIIQEALISTGLLLVYIVVVLIGIIRTMAAFPAASGYATHQNRPFTGDNRAPLSPRTAQFVRRSQSEGPPMFMSSARHNGNSSDPFGDAYATVGRTPRSNPTTQHGHVRQSSYGETGNYGNEKY